MPHVLYISPYFLFLDSAAAVSSSTCRSTFFLLQPAFARARVIAANGSRGHDTCPALPFSLLLISPRCDKNVRLLARVIEKHLICRAKVAYIAVTGVAQAVFRTAAPCSVESF